MGTQDNNDISPTVPVEHARPGFYTPCFLCTYNMQDDLSLLPKNLVTNHLIGMASFTHRPLRYATNLCLSMLICLTFSITMNNSKCGIDMQPCCSFHIKKK